LLIWHQDKNLGWAFTQPLFPGPFSAPDYKIIPRPSGQQPAAGCIPGDDMGPGSLRGFFYAGGLDGDAFLTQAGLASHH